MLIKPLTLLDRHFLRKTIVLKGSASFTFHVASRWSRLPAAQRAQFLHRIADLIQARLEEFARAESLDQGKPLWVARTIEIPRAVENFRFFASALIQSRER